ncbi:MAG: hypothetical protein HY912_19065 [Desulfomonile tiedjei]|uniref:Type 4 fimbrial biogenesis protein PilX N-terminal domain-containing protein n=1 Tax=Desulfomonile tiedjei TaxID=2358 RepID=A0A9D6V4Y4_9BACT|nr:hypothetical protein [Desulfomonile tiedjei]
MKNQRGSAIALVLLVLGVVSLVGAGLLVQTRFDEKFTQAQKNYDRTFGLADSAASYAFPEILAREAVTFRGGPTVIWTQEMYIPSVPGPTSATLAYPTDPYLGKAIARAIIQDYDTDPAEVAGDELGVDGYHAQFWIAEGMAMRAKKVGTRTSGEVSSTSDDIAPEEVVFMAAKKKARN